jgi:hypothetical protein
MAPRANDAEIAGASVRAGFGPLAVEALLVEDLRAELDLVRRDPRRLALPLRIVVPSRSLRDHVSSLLVRAVRASIAGASVQTLHGFAAAIVERDAAHVPRGACAFDVLVRRAARAESIIERELGALEAGTPVLAATIADFLDAGFRDEHAPELIDALGARGLLDALGARGLDRAKAVVRATRAVAREMAAHGIGRPSSVLARAAAMLGQDPSRARARAIWIVGFGDATGIALELIALLRDTCGARVYDDLALAIEAPADPAEAFGRRFRARLGLVARAPSEPETPRCACFRASGAQAEARAVALRVRALLDGGARPEGIGVVARELEPWSRTLRLHFDRLAIPYSGVSARGAAPIEGRRAVALAELLRRRERTAIERWLDLRAPAIDAPAHDVSLAFRALGCARLDALCDLDLAARLGSRDAFALPIRGADPARDDEEAADTADDEKDDDGAPARLTRRCVPRAVLEQAQSEARKLRDHLLRAPSRASIREHAAHARAVARDHLRWEAATPGAATLARALAELEDDVPVALELGADEFRELAARGLADSAAGPIGGSGGGVQCLTVVEARARTFEHLFVIGLNADAFPRRVAPDPLLPDDVRRRLLPVLPSLPIKSAGHAEERALFAQLVRASRNVTLSWQRVDDDGQPLRTSPLVERWLARSGAEVATAPPLFPRATDERAADALRPRPAHEHAVIAASRDGRGARASLAGVLPFALREVRASAGLPAPPPELAPARLAILDEIDAPTSRAARVGPYVGFVGALDAESDLRHADLWVTHLESMARCPWRAFVERVLHVAPAPDPLSDLPDVDARILGNAVHALLAAVGDVAARTSARIEWPSGERLDAWIAAVAEQVLRDEGLALPGLERLLAIRMRPFVDAARAVDAAERGEVLGVLATEAEGQVAIDDGRGGSAPLAFKLAFRADRIDALEAGRLLTDFKTGKLRVDSVRAATRTKDFLELVARGTHLQAAAYAFAGGDNVRGRYLFLTPDAKPDSRALAIESSDGEFRAAFDAATRTLAAAWRRGAFVPRLVDETLEDEPYACRRCEVASACVRGDSGMRQRLTAWLRASSAGDARERDPAESAATAMWRMGAASHGREDAPEDA